MELLGAVRPDQPLLVVALANEAEFFATDLPVLVTGVGKVNSGQSVLAALGGLEPDRRPSGLINIGTAGALRPGLQGTHVIGSVIQHDLDSKAIESLTGSNPAPPLLLGSGPILATGDRFIQRDDDRDRLAQLADFVDMEGYAVADAARILNMKISIVKHVSDDAGDAAVASWLESVARCSQELGGWLAAQSGTFPVGDVGQAV